MRLESNPQTITIDQDEEDATVQFAISVIACDWDDQMQKYSFENNILKGRLHISYCAFRTAQEYSAWT